ncbi:hypothetical protein TWF192_011344 [Orbilia oligospora]|uniref:Uncharacterized protein n=2 Tax=Orbilia oligospora TaxID=2813651 RepID=A0A6G1LW93_ORBOL|nr:hypothetical protein TWF191_004570 [Orbilia oligospora]KAF3236650.1 hypothetical protein TWF192_011344 [Orbilia oligospora]
MNVNFRRSYRKQRVSNCMDWIILDIIPPSYKQLGSVTKNGTIPTYLYATSSSVNP